MPVFFLKNPYSSPKPPWLPRFSTVLPIPTLPIVKFFTTFDYLLTAIFFNLQPLIQSSNFQSLWQNKNLKKVKQVDGYAI